MSEEHEAQDEAAHDPRLDAGGEDHPAVQPLPFDLIAVERTRMGLRFLGVGVGLVTFALPLVIGTQASTNAWVAGIGWLLSSAGFLCTVVALALAAPTPHGPLPQAVRLLYIVGGIAALVSSFVHVAQWLGAPPTSAASTQVASNIDQGARIALLLLTWILWRFCQYRGLSGRAIVWLWVAMACSALWLGAAIEAWRATVWGLLPIGFWACIPMAALIFLAAQQTARDVWLDAVYRNTKFHATGRPNAVVEPLHPANER